MSQASYLFNSALSGYIQFASSSDFRITTSTTPFCVEAWVYPLTSGGRILSESYTGAGDTVSIVCGLGDGTAVQNQGLYPAFGWYNGSAWTTAASALDQIATNSWTHIAFVFTGSTSKIYINGVDRTKSATPTPAATWGIVNDSGDAWYIGRRWDTLAGGTYYNGYINNLRWVIGNQVYSSNFTPTKQIPEAITGTKLLTCCTYAPIVEDIGPNNTALTVVNNGVRVVDLIPETGHGIPSGVLTGYQDNEIINRENSNGIWNNEKISQYYNSDAIYMNNNSLVWNVPEPTTLVRYDTYTGTWTNITLSARNTLDIFANKTVTYSVSGLPSNLGLVNGNQIQKVNATVPTRGPYVGSITATCLETNTVSTRQFTVEVYDSTRGQTNYTTPGTYSWTCPANITSVHVLCVGGGGGGNSPWSATTPGGVGLGSGAGGCLAWRNNIGVTPGNTYTVVVGNSGGGTAYWVGESGGGGTSTFTGDSITLSAGGGGGTRPSGTTVGRLGGLPGTVSGHSGGGIGGSGGSATGTTAMRSTGAGGAGGYSGNGGNGANNASGSTTVMNGGNGAGGGGGGGAGNILNGGYANGGGVGLYGEGASGAGGTGGGAGGGGSGGGNGYDNYFFGGWPGGGASHGYDYYGGDGSGGAVRILWGSGRSWPSTGLQDEYM